MKLRHWPGGIRLELEVCREREEVEVGSKPVAAGVTRALRLGVMLSSMLARDMRRKSVVQGSVIFFNNIRGYRSTNP